MNDQLHNAEPKPKGFFARFEIVPGQHRPNMARNGVIGLLVLGFLVYSGYSRHIPFLPKGGEVVSAQFQDAANVRGGTAVRIKGVDIGKVESVDPGNDQALVKMRIDDDKAKLLHSDAGATIYWRTLLGRNMYIELDPGTAAGKLGSATIPKTRTGSQVELDKVLSSFDEGGRKGIQEFLKVFKQGFGDGDAVRGTLNTLAPSARRIATGVGALSGTETGDLARLVKTTSDVTTSLDRSERALAGVIDGAEVTLGVTAARSSDFSSILRQAPATMSIATSEMANLTKTLDRLDPLSVRLRPGVRKLSAAVDAANPALDELRPLLAQLGPFSEKLRPSLRRLRSAARAGSPTFKAFDPALTRANEKLLPYMLSTDSHTGRKVYQLLGPTFSALDSIASSFDSKGHDVSFQTGAGLRLLGSLIPCETFLGDPAGLHAVCSKFSNTLSKRFTSKGAGATRISLGSIIKPSSNAAPIVKRTVASADQTLGGAAAALKSLSAALGGSK